jgi:hypothetical protein
MRWEAAGARRRQALRSGKRQEATCAGKRQALGGASAKKRQAPGGDKTQDARRKRRTHPFRPFAPQAGARRAPARTGCTEAVRTPVGDPSYGESRHVLGKTSML